MASNGAFLDVLVKQSIRVRLVMLHHMFDIYYRVNLKLKLDFKATQRKFHVSLVLSLVARAAGVLETGAC